jgi:LysM repeat protein
VELAKDVPLGSIPQQMQRELDRLTQTNKELQLELEKLRAELAQRLQASATGTPAPTPPADPLAGASTSPSVVSNAGSVLDPRPTPPTEPDRRSATPRTHTVRRGDTLFSIATRYGTTVAAIQSANPGVKPQRLQVGQVLKLP